MLLHSNYMNAGQPELYMGSLHRIGQTVEVLARPRLGCFRKTMCVNERTNEQLERNLPHTPYLFGLSKPYCSLTQ
jgi:hypothetical protein